MGSLNIAQDQELRDRMRRLSAPGIPAGEPESAETLLARIVWCRLAEPGDSVAGELIRVLGPAASIDLLLRHEKPQHIQTAAKDAGSDIAVNAIGEAVSRWQPRLDRAATLRDLDRAISAGLSVIAPESAGWPERLDELGEHAPILLWVDGDHTALSTFSLAVVGARACTGYGSHVTAELTDAACSAGAAIVSGAAYGIDAVAHRVALAADATTVAVVAGGVDRVYPAAHAGLYERIASSGAVCSEMVPGTAPTRWRFLQRNRIIAALSHATLVTEAGARSGSLNTAGHASEIGRPLGAVPGPVTSAASAGCHRLIREYGAALITSGTEVRELLGLDDTLFGQSEAGRQPSSHQRVVDALPLRGARTLAEVVQLSGLSHDGVRATLAELELLGQVARHENTGGSQPAWKLVRSK